MVRIQGRNLFREGELIMKEARIFLGEVTNNTFDLWKLSGNNNKKTRQKLIQLLTGNKLPLAKCGITTIRKIFYDHYKPRGDCEAIREKNFINFCKKLEQCIL